MSVIVQNSTEKGKGVFALCAFSIGEKVLISDYVKSVAERDMYSLQYDGEHIIIDEPGIIVNHSCEPNCRLVPNQQKAFDFIAIRDIQPGEEITYDYQSIEDEIVGFSACHCGADNCRDELGQK